MMNYGPELSRYNKLGNYIKFMERNGYPELLLGDLTKLPPQKLDELYKDICNEMVIAKLLGVDEHRGGFPFFTFHYIDTEIQRRKQ